MSKLYWLIPLFLWIAQLIFTQHSNTQIRYEELADSVRNVFWLENHKVYDGVSNGIGWYASLLVVFKLFGFSLFSAKYVRLFLSLISLFSLAALLYKHLKLKAILPLIAIGLSPTLLFLNSTQTEYALDLEMLPIYLLLLDSINFKDKRGWFTVLKVGLFWFIAMVGAMAYPAFVYFMPIFMALFYWKSKLNFKWILISVISFVLPLILIFTYLEPNSRNLLIYDDVTKGGLFRGAGTFLLDSDNFIHNLSGFFTDLFVRGSSYHFEVFKSDFSDILPAIALVIVISLGARQKLVFFGLALVILNLIASSSTFDPSGAPGIRRYTPTLAAIYFFYVLSWNKLSNQKFSETWKKYIIWGLFLIIPLHHILVFPVNLSHLGEESPIKYPIWFNDAGTPEQSLNMYLSKVQKEDLNLGQGRLSEIYAAVAGSCIWNHLECHQILSVDPRTSKLIPLNPQLWEDYYFEH